MQLSTQEKIELAHLETKMEVFNDFINEVVFEKMQASHRFTFNYEPDLGCEDLIALPEVFDSNREYLLSEECALIDMRRIFKNFAEENKDAVNDAYYFQVECRGDMYCYNGVKASDFL